MRLRSVHFPAKSSVLAFLVALSALLSLVGGCAEGSPQGECGNGILEPGEECDGNDFGGKTCKDFGPFVDKTPKCTAECKVDLSFCRCVDECTPGDLKCKGNMLMMCTQGDGCAMWSSYKDCAEKGLVCDESSGTPQCSESCSDSCTPEGSSQCYGNVVQECTRQENGCLAWTDKTNCAAEGQVCRDGACECPSVCTVGETRCDGSVVQECVTGANGCPEWEPKFDCAAQNKVCSTASGEAQCVATCTDACSPEGSTSCSGDMVRICRKAPSGCLEWQDDVNCAVDGKVCSGGRCVCPATCTVGDKRCNGNFVEECITGGNGCPQWDQGENCEASGRVCNTGECVCVNDCSQAGDKRCSGDVVQTCVQDSYGCLTWSDGENCAATGATCSNGECVGGTQEWYTVEEFTASYPWIGGTTIPDSTDTDDGRFRLELPFTFTYYGNQYTTIYVSANGWISFGGDPSVLGYQNGTIPDGNAPYEALYPFWDDLEFSRDTSTYTLAGLYYEIEGSAPNRVFIVEWYKAHHHSETNPSSKLIFQVRLYEGTNVIEFYYNRDTSDIPAGVFSPTVGIESDSQNAAKVISYTLDSFPPKDYRFVPTN